MEGKNKKRWRPSLTAYRELEKKLEEQIEGTSRLVQDCDGWREKYMNIREKNETLESSNRLMELELEKVREEDYSCEEYINDLQGRIFFLENRGLFARLFNKKY